MNIIGKIIAMALCCFALSSNTVFANKMGTITLNNDTPYEVTCDIRICPEDWDKDESIDSTLTLQAGESRAVHLNIPDGYSDEVAVNPTDVKAEGRSILFDYVGGTVHLGGTLNLSSTFGKKELLDEEFQYAKIMLAAHKIEDPESGARDQQEYIELLRNTGFNAQAQEIEDL